MACPRSSPSMSPWLCLLADSACLLARLLSEASDDLQHQTRQLLAHFVYTDLHLHHQHVFCIANMLYMLLYVCASVY